MSSQNKTILSSIIVLAVIVGGYYLYTQTSAPKPATDILKITSTGGLCVYGACGSDLVIRSNGSYTYKVGDGEAVEGKFSQAETNDLRSLIGNADFTAIKSKPFTGTCPIAYDGEQFTFNFYTEGEVIDSCVIAIDEASPLFMRIQNMMAQVYGQE